MAGQPRVSRQTAEVLGALVMQYPEWTYGYGLSKVTGLKSGTLYPILMRLAAQGYLEREWALSTQAGRPPRQLYRLTQSGSELARGRLSEAAVGQVAAVAGA